MSVYGTTGGFREGFANKVQAYITDRSKVFHYVACFGVSFCTAFNLYVAI